MEPLGLAILVSEALGVDWLFTACIQKFDIVVKAKSFDREFDLLCKQVRRSLRCSSLSSLCAVLTAG